MRESLQHGCHHVQQSLNSPLVPSPSELTSGGSVSTTDCLEKLHHRTRTGGNFHPTVNEKYEIANRLQKFLAFPFPDGWSHKAVEMAERPEKQWYFL